VRRVPTLHHTAAQGHYQIVLIRWLQLTEVGLYLIYLRIYKCHCSSNISQHKLQKSFRLS